MRILAVRAKSALLAAWSALKANKSKAIILSLLIATALWLLWLSGETAASFQERLSRDRVVAIGVGLALLVALVLVPRWQIAALKDVGSLDRLKAESEARQTLAHIIGGAVIFVGAYHAWTQVGYQIASNERTLAVAESGQITERFTRAVEQLGDEKLEVRLGGIYALERIARDSTRDQWTVAEVLTAFVREKTKWQGPAADNNAAGGKKPATDTQTILTILGRNQWAVVNVVVNGSPPDMERYRIDLSGADLRGAEFHGHLANAVFENAHLEGARFVGVHLEGARFTGAHLTRAGFHWAYLNGARVNHAQMQHASFKGGSLMGATLSDSDLSDASILELDMGKVSAVGTQFGGANLFEIKLDAADLHSANMAGVSLTAVDLRGVKGLTQDQLDSVRYIDAATLLPGGLRRPDSGSRR